MPHRIGTDISQTGCLGDPPELTLQIPPFASDLCKPPGNNHGCSNAFGRTIIEYIRNPGGRNRDNREFHRMRYEPEEVAVRRRGQTSCDVEMQVIAFGPVALVTNPAELFSVYSLKLKEASPFQVTLVAELTNGYCGYVPTPEAFQHRGYETYRTVYTSRLAKDAGQQILRDSVDLLRQVHGEVVGSRQ